MNAFKRLRAVEDCFRVARLALIAFAAGGASQQPSLSDAGLRPRDVQRCDLELESTYMVRLFAEFEAIIRRVWRSLTVQPRPRTVGWVINRLAARFSVPDGVLTQAHLVRRHRNGLVHGVGGSGVALSMREYRSSLATFVSFFPRAVLARIDAGPGA